MRSSLGKQLYVLPLSFMFSFFHFAEGSTPSGASSTFTRYDTVAIPQDPRGTTITTDGYTYTFSPVPSVSPSALTTVIYSNGGEMVSYSSFIVIAGLETGVDTATAGATGTNLPPPGSSKSGKQDSTSSTASTGSQGTGPQSASKPGSTVSGKHSYICQEISNI
jgi:hypothetical protein